jgi:hypothetical protein
VVPRAAPLEAEAAALARTAEDTSRVLGLTRELA